MRLKVLFDSIIKLFPWFIAAVIVVAVISRFYKLGAIPAILNPDEASIAYNAYLLRETGTDEWGRRWPIILEAFGDQKPFVYPLLTTVAFSVFGYSDFAVRFWAAAAGTAVIFLTYKLSSLFLLSRRQSGIAAAVVALLPVFIFYSRVAFEAMIALALTMTVMVLLYKVRPKQHLYDGLAVILAGISYFTYNAPFLLIPLLVLPIPFLRGVKHWQKWLITLILMFGVWLICFVALQSFNQQKSQITIFSESTFIAEYIPYRSSFSGIWQTIFGNQYVFYLTKILRNYIASFDPSFLLYNTGGHPWHAVPDRGYVYVSIFAFGLLGIGVLLGRVLYNLIHVVIGLVHHRKVQQPILQWNDLLLLWVLVVSLFPASITVNAPHATRTLLFFIILSIVSIKGVKLIGYMLSKVASHPEITRILWMGFFTMILVWEAGQYLQFYFLQYKDSTKYQSILQPGYDDVLQQIEQDYPGEPVAVIDTRGFHYVLTAWYLQIPPQDFFNSVVKQNSDTINFRYGEQVSRYHFIKEENDRFNEQVLLYWNGHSWEVKEY